MSCSRGSTRCLPSRRSICGTAATATYASALVARTTREMAIVGANAAHAMTTDAKPMRTSSRYIARSERGTSPRGRGRKRVRRRRGPHRNLETSSSRDARWSLGSVRSSRLCSATMRTTSASTTVSGSASRRPISAARPTDADAAVRPGADGRIASALSRDGAGAQARRKDRHNDGSRSRCSKGARSTHGPATRSSPAGRASPR